MKYKYPFLKLTISFKE